MSQEISDSGPRSGPSRGPRRDGPSGAGGSGGRYGGPPGLRRPRRKVCTFCVDKVQKIDYKDVGRIRRYISDRGKIDPRRKSGTCAKHQRMLTTALKRARLMAMLPYTADHVRDAGNHAAGHDGSEARDEGCDRQTHEIEQPDENPALPDPRPEHPVDRSRDNGHEADE